MRAAAFTLLEILVSVTVLVMLMGIILSITKSVGSIVGHASSKIDSLAGARAAFDLVNQKLSKATLNTYWDYDNPNAPTVYRRESDMQLLVRQNSQNPAYGQEIYFQAPETFSADPDTRSTSGLLNACGFYVQYGGNDSFRPASITSQRYRYRLMQGMQPTEALSVYKANPPASRQEPAWSDYWTDYWNKHEWTADLENGGVGGVGKCVAPLADNVIAFIIWPRLSAADDPTGTGLTSNYQYDSKKDAISIPQPITANQLPPTVQFTMVTITEASAARLDTNSNTPPQAIEDALAGKFTDVAKYRDDIDDLSKKLSDKHIEFQVFNTSVPLRESKWSDVAQ